MASDDPSWAQRVQKESAGLEMQGSSKIGVGRCLWDSPNIVAEAR